MGRRSKHVCEHALCTYAVPLATAAASAAFRPATELTTLAGALVLPSSELSWSSVPPPALALAAFAPPLALRMK